MRCGWNWGTRRRRGLRSADPALSINPNLALINLLLQVLLIAGVLGGAFLGRRRHFRHHCLTIRVLVAVQILAIALIMAPSLAGYLKNWSGFSWFTAEIIIHHVLGLVVLALWIYINLAYLGIVKRPQRFRRYMWAALAVWLVSLALGIQLYVRIWRPLPGIWAYGVPLLALAGAALAAFLIYRLATFSSRTGEPSGPRKV
jgi:hypothetical protein